MPTCLSVRRLLLRAHLCALTVLIALAVPSLVRAQGSSPTDAQAAYAAPRFFELLLKFDSLLATKGGDGPGISSDLVNFHGETLTELRKILQRGGPTALAYSVESTAPGLALATVTRKWSAASTVRGSDVVADLQAVCESWKNYIGPWFNATQGGDATRAVFAMSIYSMSTIRCAPMK